MHTGFFNLIVTVTFIVSFPFLKIISNNSNIFTNITSNVSTDVNTDRLLVYFLYKLPSQVGFNIFPQQLSILSVLCRMKCRPSVV